MRNHRGYCTAVDAAAAEVRDSRFIGSRRFANAEKLDFVLALAWRNGSPLR